MTRWNSTSMPSAVVLMMRRLHLPIAGSISSSRTFRAARKSPPYQAPSDGVTDDMCR